MSKTAPGAFFALQRATCPPTPQDRPASRRGGGSKARWQFAASGLFIWPFRVIAEQAVRPDGRHRGDAWPPPPAAALRRRVRLPPCNGPCSMGLSAFRSRRACTRADERTTRIILVRAAPSRPSPCVARWRCRRPSQRPVPVSDRWLTGAAPASPMAPICSSTCIACPRSRDRADAGWVKARRGQPFRHRASQPWRSCVAVQTAERRRREGVVKNLRSEPVNGWAMSRIDTNRHKNPEGECGRFCKCCIKLSLADGSGFVVFPARSANG